MISINNHSPRAKKDTSRFDRNMTILGTIFFIWGVIAIIIARSNDHSISTKEYTLRVNWNENKKFPNMQVLEKNRLVSTIKLGKDPILDSIIINDIK